MNIKSGYSFFPLGDSALLIEFGNEIDEEISKIVLGLFYHLKEKKIAGVVDIVPAYSSIAVFYDVPTIAKYLAKEETVFDKVVDTILKTINSANITEVKNERQIKVPVCYEKKFGIDLEWLAKEKNISIEDVIRLHTSKSYRVYMIGFLPGFAYMGEVDSRIQVGRRKEPRLKVERGSIGIAGKQTGIYSIEAPGGWQIIGRTPVQIFDKTSQHSVLFQPGDEVIFYPITAYEFENYTARTV